MTTVPTGAPRAARSLTTRYLMTCAAIGAAAGVLLIPANVVGVLLVPTAPVLYAALVGLWVLGPVVALALLRRPGAALLTMLVAGVVSSLSPYGPWSVVTCLMVGAALELGFVVTRYRVWQPWLFHTTVLVFVALYTWSAWVSLDVARMVAGVQVVFVVLMVASAVVGTAGGLALARRLERAGVARGLARPAAAAPSSATSSGASSAPSPVETLEA